jgi:hypothetical protein
MATTLHRVPENFIYQVEQIVPTYQGRTVPRFRSFEPDGGEQVPEATGGLRMFFVEWLSSGPDGGATMEPLRESEHLVQLHVEYPFVLKWEEMHMLVLQDRHDLIKRLRDPQYFVGYKGSTSGATGMFARWRLRDLLDKTTRLWRYSSQWRCTVREEEV